MHPKATSWRRVSCFAATEIYGLVRLHHNCTLSDTHVQSANKIERWATAYSTHQLERSSVPPCPCAQDCDSARMPPARPRALDDSRSETSSTIGLLKEKNTQNIVTGSGVSKNKRTMNMSHAGSVKANVNGTTLPPARAEQIDLSLPKVCPSPVFKLQAASKHLFVLKTQVPANLAIHGAYSPHISRNLDVLTRRL
jgi:hypothetical protein